MTFLRRASYVLATGLLTTAALRADPPVAFPPVQLNPIPEPPALAPLPEVPGIAKGLPINDSAPANPATGGSARSAVVVRSPVART
ncbi:MAG TPA: hypothetical protein VM597_01240 [Gemmataceae bacterium]|nr:hypothetical protein [Gemmataceae bacterium]